MCDQTLLSLQPSLREKLIQNGFLAARDFTGLGPAQLSRDAGITPLEALKVLESIKTSKKPDSIVSITALDALKSQLNGLCTGSSQIDQLFGGGIPQFQITELYGSPGSGKTQLAIQLCINAQLPVEMGGLNASSLYIDTEGSFMPSRALEMAHSFENPLEALKRIRYIRILDYIEQIAVFNLIEDLVKQDSNLKLVVVDSIAFHFRHSFTDMPLRSRILSNIGLLLNKLCSVYKITIVIVNQVNLKQAFEESKPALGETWSHIVHNRLLLSSSGDGQRFAKLTKSATFGERIAHFCISTEGFCDSIKRTNSNSPQPNAKKPRQDDPLQSSSSSN